MRAFTTTMAVITMLLLTFVLICGLWIGANGTDAEGLAFHRMLGIAGVISGMLTAVTALIAVRRKRANA